jgi:hypothetical protein
MEVPERTGISSAAVTASFQIDVSGAGRRLVWALESSSKERNIKLTRTKNHCMNKRNKVGLTDQQTDFRKVGSYRKSIEIELGKKMEQGVIVLTFYCLRDNWRLDIPVSLKK